jgi:hypothetical protein
VFFRFAQRAYFRCLAGFARPGIDYIHLIFIDNLFDPGRAETVLSTC